MVIVNVIGKDMEKNCEANYLIPLSQDFFSVLRDKRKENKYLKGVLVGQKGL